MQRWYKGYVGGCGDRRSETVSWAEQRGIGDLAATHKTKGSKMETINGKDFKLKVLGSGLTMKQVYEKADISSTTASKFTKGNSLTVTYDKLIAAYNELTKDR